MTKDLLAAAKALGALPEGYCFCSSARIGNDSKPHEAGCRDMRAAIAEAEAGPMPWVRTPEQQIADLHAAANAYLERARVAEAVADGQLDKAYLLSASPAYPRGFEMLFKTPLGATIGAFFYEGMQALGPDCQNYVELRLNHDDFGPLTLTSQRVNGRTPGERAAELQRRLDAPIEVTDAMIRAAAESRAHGCEGELASLIDLLLFTDGGRAVLVIKAALEAALAARAPS